MNNWRKTGFLLLIRTLLSVSGGYDEGLISAMLVSVAKAKRLMRLKNSSPLFAPVTDFCRGVMDGIDQGTVPVLIRLRKPSLEVHSH